MGNLITWSRGINRPLSAHFNSREFTCSCGICSQQRLDGDLITRLEALRDVVGPLTVMSGFRCANKQAQLRKAGYETSKGTSMHEYGMAADIAAADMKLLAIEVPKLFHAYGIAHTFIHVDLRPAHPNGTPLTWSYKT